MAFILSPRYLLLLSWLVPSILLGGLLFTAEAARSGLNDPDPARERPGFLSDGPRMPTYIQTDGRPVLLLLARSLNGQQLFHDLAVQSDLTKHGQVIVITQDGSRPTITNGLTFLRDSDGSIARGLGIRMPQDNGYPIGYVIADGSGSIRYRTIDPHFQHLTSELTTMFKAVR